MAVAGVKKSISSEGLKAYLHGNGWHEVKPIEGFTVAAKAQPNPIPQAEQADFIRTILSNTRQFRGLLDTEGKFTDLNQLALTFLGLSRDELQGFPIWQGSWWLSGRDRLEVQTLTKQAMAGKPAMAEFEIVGKTGRLWIEFLLKPIFNGSGNLVMILAEGNDISESKRLEQQLRESEEQHRQVIEAMAEGVIQFERDGTASMCNSAAERIMGQSRENLMKRTLTKDWFAIKEDGTPLVATDSPTALTFATGEPQSNFVMGIHKPSGELTWALVNTQPLKHSGDAAPYAVLITLIDITERKRLEDKLRQAALYDALTGLPTRTLLMERLSQAIARHKRDAHSTFALLFIDLDNFKTVNDTLGHAAGDAVLIQVAKKLKSSLRETDTAARLGGDEFLVLLEGLESQEAAQIFAERISSELVITCGKQTEPLEVRASIGIAHHDGSDLSAYELLAKADKAMYRTKARRKGQVTS